MADGYARATGKPACDFTINRPGLLNIRRPGTGWSDSSNVLVIPPPLISATTRKAVAAS